MKLQTAFLAFALLLGPAAAVHARPAAHFPSTHSFKGGFSSHRNAGFLSPPPSQGRTGFGSFGGVARAAPGGSGAAKAAPSSLSGSLSQQAAKENALRTLDQRRAAAQPAPPPPAGSYGRAPATPAQPIVVQQHSGVGDMVAGYMLGRMASHGYGAPATLPYPAQERRDQDSPGTSFLHTFLWLLALSALGWGIWLLVRRMRAAKQARTPNYTFERD